MNNYSIRGRKYYKGYNTDKWNHFKSENARNVRDKREIENCKTIEQLEKKLKWHKLFTKNVVLIALCEKLIKEKK